MMKHEYVTPPIGGIDYLSLFRTALSAAEFDQLDIAVAYATMGGVAALQSVFGQHAQQWKNMKKRCLVGVDWCRTEPIALDALADFSKSSVKIPNGKTIVQHRGCTPTLPFHPKAFILRGEDTLAIISGSGNLSRNGLTRGHECGNVLVLSAPLTEAEDQIRQNVQRVVAWFDQCWREATQLRQIRDSYARHHDDAENLRNPPPTDDDAAPTDRTATATMSRRAIPPQRLRQLRAARHLWIQAGNLHKNRGPGNPGNQLMMSPMTRVFFGFAARDADPDTFVGDVTLQYHSYVRHDCSLRFSNNSMDVLTLPVPDAGGPAKYDQETLLFEKQANHSFVLSLGTTKDIRQWQQQSRKIDASFAMTSDRQWGVF